MSDLPASTAAPAAAQPRPSQLIAAAPSRRCTSRSEGARETSSQLLPQGRSRVRAPCTRWISRGTSGVCKLTPSAARVCTATPRMSTPRLHEKLDRVIDTESRLAEYRSSPEARRSLSAIPRRSSSTTTAGPTRGSTPRPASDTRKVYRRCNSPRAAKVLLLLVATTSCFPDAQRAIRDPPPRSSRPSRPTRISTPQIIT